MQGRTGRRWVTWLTLALLGAGCASSGLGTETGNPPVITPSLVKVVDAGDGRVAVRGQPGAVSPGGGQVEVRNLDLADEVTTVDVAPDGSFEATLAGDIADDFELVSLGNAGRSEPRFVSRDSDWRTLHPCEDGDPVDPLNVTALRIEGDTLHVDVSHAGGCAEHAYGLCYGPSWDESDPIQVPFTVLHDAMGDSCEALQSAALTFDLRRFERAFENAYQTSEGAASLGFSDCVLEGEPPGGCRVLYEWPEASELPLELPQPPGSWSVRRDCGLRVTLPPDMVAEATQGIDSCVAAYEGEVCELGVDAGFASNPLDDVEGATTLLGTVGGREARMITTEDEDELRPHVLGIHFPSPSDGQPSATLFGRCESEAAREALLPALGSVRFD